ncbi:MAG: hypothetical protein NZR01_00540 [Bryobacteraceae bacterium]|nr:hypothetical protein [Bryobacteraceae bacterium]
MLRRLILTVCCAGLAQAQIWPESWHGSKRVKAAPVAPEDPALWAEYGGEAAERALYDGPVGRFAATAWRLQDATGALAWYQANRPAKCTPVRDSYTRCVTPGGMMLAHQNYVLLFEGWRPLEKELQEFYRAAPAMRSGGGLPYLPGYLPEKGLVRNSERYLLGVHSLSRFLPSVPPSIVGFEDGAEVQAGKLELGSTVADYAIFYYHTPQLARQREREFRKQPGWLVKRSYVLVAVFPGGAPEALARPVLDALEWKAEVVRNEGTTPPPVPNVGGLLLGIFKLTGLLLLICFGGGCVFAFFAALLRRRRIRLYGNDDPMTVVRID